MMVCLYMTWMSFFIIFLIIKNIARFLYTFLITLFYTWPVFGWHHFVVTLGIWETFVFISYIKAHKLTNTRNTTAKVSTICFVAMSSFNLDYFCSIIADFSWPLVPVAKAFLHCSESESELFLLSSKFTPTRNLFWHIGADNKHTKHNKYYTQEKQYINCKKYKKIWLLPLLPGL